MAANAKPRPVYTITCVWGCGTTWNSPLRPPTEGVGCGKGECNTKHNAAVAEADELRRQRRNRLARERRAAGPQVVMAGEWAQVGMLLGAVRKGGR
ncbi:MAG TPA: hypothetical protein VGL80_20830 [Pseudonocardiaceae bacterium]|jgi:hypothetical protein